MDIKEFLKENKRILICTALAILAGILIGVSIGIALTPNDDGAAVAAMEMVSVGPNTAVRTRLKFDGCAHEYERLLDNARFVGATRQELLEHFPKHTIVRFSAEQVVLEQEIDGCCQRHYLLKLADNGGCAILKFDEEAMEMNTAVPIDVDTDAFDETVLSELRSGVAFDSMDEVNAYLEGLES